MFIGIRRYKVRHGCEERIIDSAKNFLPVVESLPGFKYYHLYDWPDHYVTAVNAFDVRESVVLANERALDWVYQHAGNLIEGRPEVSTCTTLVSG
jgi:hypothetical protein